RGRPSGVGLVSGGGETSKAWQASASDSCSPDRAHTDADRGRNLPGYTYPSRGWGSPSGIRSMGSGFFRLVNRARTRPSSPVATSTRGRKKSVRSTPSESRYVHHANRNTSEPSFRGT